MTIMKTIRQHIFLVDGIGASVSAFMLGIVLPAMGVGLPENVLWALALVALLFALYSLGCYLKQKGGAFLRVILLANLLYCAATAIIVVRFSGQMNGWGLAYFIGELLVIIILCRIELGVVREYSAK